MAISSIGFTGATTNFFTGGTGSFNFGGMTFGPGSISWGTPSPTTTTTLRNPTTVTTVTTQKFDNGVIDVSIIPYMRHKLVQFNAEGLRPNRRVYFFFDDESIDDYIINTDELTLVEDNVQVFNAGTSNNDTITGVINGGRATVVQAGRFFDFTNSTPSLNDDAKPKQRRRILRLANSSLKFANAEGFIGSVTGTTGTVGALRIRGGETLQNFFANSSSNTIQLPVKTSVVANNYWGTDGSNTIILMPRRHRRGRTVRAYITGFNNVNQILYLSNTAGGLASSGGEEDDEITSNGSNQVSWTIGGEHRTDYEGKISGIFSIPPAKFRTGERIFRIIDDPANDPADCTTRAEYRFIASGLQLVKNDVVVTSTKTVILPPPPTVRPRPRPPEGNRRDPIAQTFFVDASEHPNGVFISSVGLYFYNRDEVLPVSIQIRPTVNGYPHSYEVLPYAEASLSAEYVKTSTDASLETKIKFDVPIYLEPGEYALVVKSDSLQYEVFVSELGSKVLGTNSIVSEQPYLGSFFKSQNSSTWDAIQLEDLTFKLYKCVFNTAGNVTFYNENPEVNTPADVMFAHIDDTKVPNTSIQYVHSYEGVTPVDGYIPDTNFRPASGRVTISTAAGQYRLKAFLSTNDTDVSPVIMNKSGAFLAIENTIDNAEFSADDFTIVSPGYYSANANSTVPLIVSDYRGTSTQTVAYANVNSSGNVSNIYVVSSATGFINTASVRVSCDNATTQNAVIKLSSETDASGGPAIAKYISRTVTLAEGFSAGDLRVFLTAYKPSGTDIKVYYKVKSADDSDLFADKGYQLMNQKTKASIYSGKNNYGEGIEYEFEPYDASNAISYSTSTTTYSSFDQFSIKIVLLAEDTTNVPIVYDMRAIALPAMST